MAVYPVRSAVGCTSPGHGCRLRGVTARAMKDSFWPFRPAASPGQLLGWLGDAALVLGLALAFPRRF